MKAMLETVEAERKPDWEEMRADREQWKAKMDEMFTKIDRKASPEMMKSVG
jgi:hypothetical protein